MKIISMVYVGIRPKELNKSYPFPTKVTFDNGNSRVVHNEKDCLLLEGIVYKKKVN